MTFVITVSCDVYIGKLNPCLPVVVVVKVEVVDVEVVEVVESGERGELQVLNPSH